MKNSSKIVIGVIIAISFVAGFFIGVIVDYPKTNPDELTGTIGKMNNYRNVKVTENDIKLRSDLLANKALLKSYQNYFSFHYISCTKRCDDIDFAIKSAENVLQFKETYSTQIENVKRYKQTLDQARKDILLTLTTLQKLSESNENDIAFLINNANIAIAQIKYKEGDLLQFVDCIEKFVQGNNPTQLSDLIKAHDLLSINQIIIAAATNDKPLMKYFDKKGLMASKEDLNIIFSNNQLNSFLMNDFQLLQSDLKNNEKLNRILDTDAFGNVEKQLGELIPSFEKLNVIIWSTADNIGAISSGEKLGSTECPNCPFILNTEKLGTILNSEKLGLFSSEKLGLFNIEKLGAANIEKLNIII